jgi:glycosyltransferase involved in cell wall biosynthesis
MMITAAELTADPRARRAAEEAARRGLDVQGLCVSDLQELPGIAVKRVSGPAFERRIRELGVMRVGRSSRVAREIRGIYRLGRHALITSRYVRAVRGLEPCEIVHANDFDTLPAAAIVARRWGARLIYDSHELYTFQEPDPPRLYCLLVRAVEGRLARRSDALITVNPSYAEKLTALFRLRQAPFLVMNCPPLEAVSPASPPADGRLRVVYQAAMGPGRRVEDLVEAAVHTGDSHITIRVVGADRKALRRLIDKLGVEERVTIADPAPPDTLVQALAPFDVGVVINRPVTANDEFVLPNKLFEYMMASLAVVTPDLPLIGRFVARERVGVTFSPGDSAAMGHAIQRLADDRELLRDSRERARKLAVETYNAESQASELARAWGIAP